MSRGRKSKILGCLLGGAVGDALGAPVEFMSLPAIRHQFGEQGIQRYAPAYGRLGAITDDTQMTLFTLEGLLRASMRFRDRGLCHIPTVVWHAYLRWLGTQGEIIEDDCFLSIHNGWLLQQKELYSLRGPGNTCLSALRTGYPGSIKEPINNSKGCGGIMRVAPVGLMFGESFELGCETAAITHGHPTGYLAAGFLAQVIEEIMRNKDLGGAIVTARDVLTKYPNNDECLRAVDAAVDLAKTADPTAENVEKLGQGWVAEEALAISLFCVLKAKDFAHGVRLAVNHSGDSDSTGAITGNILGALWGRSSIPEEFLVNLELREVIEEIARDVTEIGDKNVYWEKYPPY